MPMEKKATSEHETLLPQKSLCIKKHCYCSGYIKLVLQATKQCGAKIAVPLFSGTHKASRVARRENETDLIYLPPSHVEQHGKWSNDNSIPKSDYVRFQTFIKYRGKNTHTYKLANVHCESVILWVTAGLVHLEGETLEGEQISIISNDRI